MDEPSKANKLKGETEVEFGGKAIKLRLNSEALFKIEKDLGYGVVGMAQADRMGFVVVSTILFRALEVIDHKASLQKVLRLMEPERFTYFAKKTTELINVITPVDEESSGGDAEEAEPDPTEAPKNDGAQLSSEQSAQASVRAISG